MPIEDLDILSGDVDDAQGVAVGGHRHLRGRANTAHSNDLFVEAGEVLDYGQVSPGQIVETYVVVECDTAYLLAVRAQCNLNTKGKKNESISLHATDSYMSTAPRQITTVLSRL